MKNNTTDNTTDRFYWAKTHFPMILYSWFWLGLILCALFAPSDRVLILKSQLITQGWHLAVLSALLGGPVMWLYWRRFINVSEPRQTQTQSQISAKSDLKDDHH